MVGIQISACDQNMHGSDAQTYLEILKVHEIVMYTAQPILKKLVAWYNKIVTNAKNWFYVME